MHKQQGITLIELMIAVVIVGIIAAVAYPSYTSFMEKARRADGQSALMALAAAMERTYTAQNTYLAAVSGAIPAANVFPSQAPLDGNDKYYNLRVPAGSLTATSFVIQAIPIGAQSSDPCGTLTLSHTGERNVTGGSLSSEQCWN